MLRNRFGIALAAVTLWTITVAPLPVSAQVLTAEAINELAETHHDDALRLYREFLRLPNDAAYPGDIARLVEWMEDAFAARGFETSRIETPGSPPATPAIR